MIEPLVRLVGVSRAFGTRVAVQDLTLSVAPGEIVALLGPNGAGKTTTLRMMAGLIAPSQGDVRVHGRVGLLTEAPGLWERLSVRTNLITYARLHGVGDADLAVARALDLVDLGDRAADAAGELSKGLKQRVAIARTLIHDPAVVLLDEPTSGLDPASARHVRDLIAGLRSRGRAVLVSTHNLAEAEALADRIAVLKTRLLALDAAAALRRGRTGASVAIDLDGPADSWLAVVAGLGDGRADGHRLFLTLPGEHAVPDAVTRLVQAGARITRVTPADRSLEDVYLELVEHD